MLNFDLRDGQLLELREGSRLLGFVGRVSGRGNRTTFTFHLPRHIRVIPSQICLGDLRRTEQSTRSVLPAA